MQKVILLEFLGLKLIFNFFNLTVNLRYMLIMQIK